MSSTMIPQMTLTASAANKVWELIEEEGNFDLKLRVYITGGGCSGFQYGFSFEEAANDDDMVIKKAIKADETENEADDGAPAITVLVDPMSYQYLIGAEIDYKEDLEGARFIIRNPNAQTTCGCGSSFSA